MIICTKCGFKNKDGETVCKACRQELEVVVNQATDLNNNGQANLEELVKEAIKCTVAIKCYYTVDGKHTNASAGSGFIVDKGYVVTNSHVIESEGLITKITATFEKSVDNVEYDLQIVDALPEADIIVLKFASDTVASSMSKRENLHIRETPLRFGESVYTIGNPMGLGIAVNNGVVACPNRKMKYRGINEVVQLSFKTNHGNSGGALLDMNNQVCGITTFCSLGEDNDELGMCVPSKRLKNFINLIEEEE